MKKIIGALLVGAMIGGVAFAEVAIKLDNANKMNFLTVNSDQEKQATFSEFQYKFENRFYLTVKGENAGVEFVPRFNSYTKSNAIIGAAKVETGSDDSKSDAADVYATGLFHRIEWSAYAKFGGIGKVTVGNFDSRNANRVTTGAFSYDVWEMAKLGYSTFSVPSTAGKLNYSQNESDYIARAGNTNVNAVGDLYFGPVTLQLGYRNAAGKTSEYSNYFVGNWGVRVFGDIGDFVKLTATVATEDEATNDGKKNKGDDYNRGANDRLDLGVFAQITAIKKYATVVVGYSGGFPLTDNTNIGKEDKWFGIGSKHSLVKAEEAIHAINLRATMPLLDKKLNITTHDDFSFTKNGDDDTMTNIYNLLNVSYKINNIFTPALYFANNVLIADGDSFGAFMIAPRCTINVTSGVTLDAGVEFRNTYSNTDDFKTSTNIQIPINLRIQVN